MYYVIQLEVKKKKNQKKVNLKTIQVNVSVITLLCVSLKNNKLQKISAILPMQCGSFKGATQKGLRIGGARDVLPHIIGGELPRKEGEFNLTECK